MKSGIRGKLWTLKEMLPILPENYARNSDYSPDSTSI
jgi:hypothetical protein